MLTVVTRDTAQQWRRRYSNSALILIHGMEGNVKQMLFLYSFAFFNSTILAIAGDDFSVIGSDLRLSEGYSIHTRDCPKTYTL